MRSPCRLALVAVVLASAAMGATQAQQPGQHRFALLVGINEYPNLSKAEQLEGSINDSEAMSQLLRSRFRFADNDIAMLRNKTATGDAIRRHFNHLAQRLAQLPQSDEAYVVFHFSGHGSQIADQAVGQTDRDEDDGLDETLVPSDATAQGGEQDIRDDELNRFVSRLADRPNTHLWIVLDCCHSGSGTRGATKVRKLDRGLPAAAIEAEGYVSRKTLPPNVVVLTACRAREVEPEYREGEKTYGLLTRFLVRVLNEHPTLSELDYGALHHSLVAAYRQDPAVMQPPTPEFEGARAALNRSVLGATRSSDRPPYFDAVVEGFQRRSIRLKGGELHGVNAGALLQLYATAADVAAGEKDQSIGWLRVEKATPIDSQARFELKNPQSDELEAASLPSNFRTGVAVLRQKGSSGIKTIVRVVRHTSGADSTLLPDCQDVPTAIRDTLQAASDFRPIAWVGDDQPCDLIIRIVGDKAAVFPATGVAMVSLDPSSDASPLRGGWGPIDLADTANGCHQLQTLIDRIVRARELIRVAAAQSTKKAPSESLAHLELMKVECEDDGVTPKSFTSWDPASGDAHTMHEGDVYAFRISHRKSEGLPVYVTVLTIDADMGIDIAYPFQEGQGNTDENRLFAGSTKLSDCFQAKSLGRRTAVLLATPEPRDFSYLVQPALQKARGDRRLIRPTDTNWSAQVISWQVEPQTQQP